jgi:hypothetical protein
MTAFIFVYERTSFRNDSTHPVKQFDPALDPHVPFASAPIAIAAGGVKELERGIYGILSEDSGAIELVAADPSKEGVTFDLVILRGKDPWPRFASQDQLWRIGNNFKGVSHDEIDQFLGARDSNELADSMAARSA